MEPVGTFAEGEYWSALCGMSTEEADFMAQLLGSCAMPGEHNEINPSFGNPSSFSWRGHGPTMSMDEDDEKGSYYRSDNSMNSNLHNFLPQGSRHSGSSSGSFCFRSSSHKSYHITDSNQMFATINGSASSDFCMVDNEQTNSSFPDSLMEESTVCINQEISTSNLRESGGVKEEAVTVLDQKLQPKRKFEMPKPHSNTKEENDFDPIVAPRRRCQVPRNKKNTDSKKNLQKLKAISNDEEEANAGLNRQSTSSCSSEDDSNGSQELNGGETSCSKGSASLNSNGKSRASRGSATDPQSLYARKRRERINERLRILQNLVPNGTKVDISTMLEEAALYVKFLQLQIKLLSSDDLWMYAPIAYNGMDIGLDLNISPSRT